MKKATVKLPEHIKRGSKVIKEVSLLEPKAMHLQGLEIMGVIRGNVDQVVQLIPRITECITEVEAKNLSFKNLAAISLQLTSFLGD